MMMSARRWNCAAAIALACLLVVVAACQKKVEAPEKTAQKEEVQVAEAVQPRKLSLYDRDMQPLTSEECSQCHLSIFRKIKDEGGKHRIPCVQCHEKYHAFSARKQNYGEIMPKCATCHVNAEGKAFHGEQEGLTDCLACHEDAHRPLIIPMGEIEEGCASCHTSEKQEMVDSPSAHAESVSCTDCHAEKHGAIPNCAECHESHSPEVAMEDKDCQHCHPVHRPKDIHYETTVSNQVCAGCHQDAFHQLTTKITKHSTVACAECHVHHKELVPCSKCHGQPHSSAMMQDTSKCNQCHGKAHALAAD